MLNVIDRKKSGEGGGRVNEGKCHHMAFLNEPVKDRSRFNSD